MKLSARLELDLKDSDVIARALKPDDLGWTRCHSAGNKLIIEAETEKTGAILNALDDYMLNIKAASSLLELLNRLGVNSKF
jgi:hypothetical protein